MTIKKILESRIARLTVGSLFFTFVWKIRPMLVNSKEIAENVKTAIIEAGTQVSSDFKDVIETTKPVWPNKDSCLTFLGLVCATGGILFIYQGLFQIINHFDQVSWQSSVNQGIIKIGVGIIGIALGITIIHLCST